MGHFDTRLPGPRNYLNEADRWSRTSPESILPTLPPPAGRPTMPGPSPAIPHIESLADTDPYHRPKSVHPTSVHSPPLPDEKHSENPMQAFDEFQKDSEAIYEAVRRGSQSSAGRSSRRYSDVTTVRAEGPGHATTHSEMRDDTLINELRARRLSDVNVFLKNASQEEALRAESLRLRREIALTERWAAERQEGDERLRRVERELQALRAKAEIGCSASAFTKGSHRPAVCETARAHGVPPFAQVISAKSVWDEWEAELAEEDRLYRDLSRLSRAEKQALLTGKMSRCTCKTTGS